MKLVSAPSCSLLTTSVASAQVPFSSSAVTPQSGKHSTLALVPRSSSSTLVLPPANDDCTAPQPLVGAGPYPLDTTTATTSAVGQACVGGGSSTIDLDVWFCWTAPSSGSFEVTTFGLATFDTKVALYDACGCPAAPSIACNDDACGTLQSLATFSAVAGNVYTIQIGSFPGALGGVGFFDVVPTPGVSGCTYDDGASENSIGLTNGGSLGWMQRFGAIGGTTLVTEVSASYGATLFPGGGPLVGTPVDVLVWDDPNDDGNPTDCVLAFQGSGVVTAAGLIGFDVYPTTPVVLPGVFFAGVALAHGAGVFPAGLDMSSCVSSAPSWVFGANSGPLDYNLLTNNPIPPTNASTLFGGVWMLRAGCATTAGISFCGNGDPNRIACPCSNNGTHLQAGCANSLNPAGALLTTSGFAPTDDVVLFSTGMTGTVCIFIRTLGPQQTNGVIFGDGVTCTGGSLLRLRAITFPAGIGSTARFPEAPPPTTITLSARSGTFPGSGAVMQYASFYRNAAAAFCPPFTFNTSNTIEIAW